MLAGLCQCCLKWSKHCSIAGKRGNPSCAQQYVVLGDLGVHKTSINKSGMMTTENLPEDEKSFDSDPKESQRT